MPPCLRLPGVRGIGHSDSVQVTADGGEPLTGNDWRLCQTAERVD